MKRLFLMCLLLGALVAVFPVVGKAAIAPNIVGWEDNDFENLLDVDGSLDFSVHDLIIGMWQVQKVGYASTDVSAWPVNDQYTAVYVQEVTNVAPGGQFAGGSQITFGAVPWGGDADGDGFDDTWESLGLMRTNPGTMAVLYSDLGPAPKVTSDVDGLGPSYENVNVPGFAPPPAFNPAVLNILDELQTAQDGTMLWEVGFTGAPQEFWVADVNSATIPPPAALALEYVASGNVTVYGAGGISLPHTYFSSVGTNVLWSSIQGAGPDIVSQWQLAGSSMNVSPGDFHVATDSDIFHAIPAPSTALIFLGLFTLAAVSRRLRRKKG